MVSKPRLSGNSSLALTRLGLTGNSNSTITATWLGRVLEATTTASRTLISEMLKCEEMCEFPRMSAVWQQ